ncbi:MAG TPA: hypothetical protein VEC10_03795 [Steroidobacteraceae bacterium]|nr:hypothetical protein [Steroidobacteraceae bacterium]
MIYLLALLPATGLTVAGYFVLVLSTRAEGALRTFGKYLGFWAFTLAGLVILGALFAAAHGGHREAMYGMRAMHGPMHCPRDDDARFSPRGEGRAAPRPPDEVAPPPEPPPPPPPRQPLTRP